jgi:ArsR family transcriptional regulator
LESPTCTPPRKARRRRGPSDEELATLCKALGHPARVRILRILSEKGSCISGDLAEEFELAQSTVSEHLRILKEAKLVQGTIDGPRRCYCVDPDAIDLLKELVAEL